METSYKPRRSPRPALHTPAPELTSSPSLVTVDMSFSRSQQISSSSLNTASSRSMAGLGLGYSGGLGLGYGGGLGLGYSSGLGLGYSGGLGFRSSAGLGLGSSAGLGLGCGAGLGLGLGSGAGLGLGSGAGLGLGLGSGFAAGYGSRYSGGGYGGGAIFRAATGSFSESVANIVNDKQQLQILNDRLATYLEKVKRLETTNLELNEKLRSFTLSRVHSSVNMEPYEIQIKPLREKLLLLIQEHTKLALDVDNAKLAADDFRIKYETELSIRQSVEGDVAGLKILKKEYDSTNNMLRQEVTALTDERNTVRKLQQDELISLRGHMAGTVTVDLRQAESTDLSRLLAEIRSEYEMLIEKNRRELESWYTKQVEKKQVETTVITETAVSGSSEITENRKQSLVLQTQLDSALMKKANMEQHLVEVQAQYQAQIFALSQLAGGLEGELSSVRESALQQSRDYQMLLSTKVQLEREISTYKALLEGAGEFTGLTLIKLRDGISASVGGSVSVGGATADTVGGATVEAGK